MAIDAEMLKKLRASTGAGVMDIKKALEEAGNDYEKAQTILRKSGHAKAAKRSARETSAGLIEAYVHMGRVGALVEVSCETDFVARTDELKTFAKQMAMQVAASAPEYLEPQEVPKKVIDREKEIYLDEVKDKPKPAQDKIILGKLDKFFEQNCLLKQVAIEDPKQTVEEKLKNLIAKLGENIVIKRFSRFELGE